MDKFKDEGAKTCFQLLSKARNIFEADLAWRFLQNNFPHLRAMVALENYDKEAVPRSIQHFSKQQEEYLVPYFSSTHIYFLGDQLRTDMLTLGEANIRVDYSLMFDTNLASYINKIVRGEALGGMHNQIVSLIDSILQDDLNFDHLFYMVENTKNVLPLTHQSTSKIKFWRSLNKKFRQNMVSLQVFLSIDGQKYRRTSAPTPQASYREAARNAINFCYDFYASEIGKENVAEFTLLQRILLLQLIGMLRIQLSTNKGPKYKMNEYFNFVHNEIGAYFDREAILAHSYFSDRNNIEMLEKIKRGMNTAHLLRKLDNIAWDMAAPRFMERLLGTKGNGDFFVPFFLTFDKGLRELLSIYRVKGVIFNNENGQLIPIPNISSVDYFEHHGHKDEIEYLFSDDVKNERLSRPKPTRASIHKKVRDEYAALRKVLIANKQPRQ